MTAAPDRSSTMTTPLLFTVLAEANDTLTWLGQFPTLDAASASMNDWLASDDRDDEDVAFIVPVLGFGSREGHPHMTKFAVYAHGTFWGEWDAATAAEAIQKAADEVGTIDVDALHASTDGMTAVACTEDKR
jgi:hypothetical protein